MQSIPTGVAVVIGIFLFASPAVGVPWGQECAADSLVGVVEAGVRRDDLDTRSLQLLGELLQAAEVEAELVDAGHYERVDSLAVRGVEKPDEAATIRRLVVDVPTDLVSGCVGDPFARGPLGLHLLGRGAGQAGVEDGSHPRAPDSMV